MQSRLNWRTDSIRNRSMENNRFLHVYKRRRIDGLLVKKRDTIANNNKPALVRCSRNLNVEEQCRSSDELFRNIPSDLFPNILKCLPVISLCRFMCVCTSWKSMIIKNFHSSPRRPIVGTAHSSHEEVSIYSFDINSNEVGTPNILCTYSPEQPFSFLSFSICNGLFCFREHTRNMLGVLNPSSQEEPVYLPKNSEYFRRYHYRHRARDPVRPYDAHVYDFGFEPLSQKFKVLGHTHYPICQIYTFEGKNKSSTWRSVVNMLPSECGNTWHVPTAVCINGILYWFSDTDYLISFDLASETFRAIQGPNRVEHVEGNNFKDKGRVCHLFEYDGCLCLINLYRLSSKGWWTIWMHKQEHMKDDSDGWVIMASFVLSRSIRSATPFCTRPGEVLFGMQVKKDKVHTVFHLYSFITKQFDTVKIAGAKSLLFAIRNYEENSISLNDV